MTLHKNKSLPGFAGTTPWGEPIDLLMLAKQLYEQQKSNNDAITSESKQHDVTSLDALSAGIKQEGGDLRDIRPLNLITTSVLDQPKGVSQGLLRHHSPALTISHSSLVASAAPEFLSALSKLPERWSVDVHKVLDFVTRQGDENIFRQSGLLSYETVESRSHVVQEIGELSNVSSASPQDSGEGSMQAAGDSLEGQLPQSPPGVQPSASLGAGSGITTGDALASESASVPNLQTQSQDGASTLEGRALNSVTPQAQTPTGNGQSLGSVQIVSLPDGVSVPITPIVSQVTATFIGNEAVSDHSLCQPFYQPNGFALHDGTQFTAQVTISDVQNGLLSDAIGGSYDAITGTYFVSGSASEVTAAVNALTFQPTAHQVTPGQTVATTLDLTFQSGTTVTQTSLCTVVVTAGDDAPMVNGNLPVVSTTDTTIVHPFAAIQVSDVDFGKIETVSVALDQVGSGSLSDAAGGSYDPELGIYQVSGSASAVTIALQALIFTPTAHQIEPGGSVTTNVAVTVNDGLGGVTTGSTTIVATAIDDAPSLTGSTPSLSTSDAASVHPFASIQVSDVDFGKVETASVSLDQVGNGTLSDPVSGAFDPTLGVYTVSGSASLVTTALDALTFQPTAHQVVPGQSIVTNLDLTVSDGYGGVASSITSVIATANEDAPIVSGTIASLAIGDSSSSHPFSTIQVADVDVGKTETVTVTLAQAGNGSLSDALAGSYDAALGSYSASGSPAEVTADLNCLVFSPTAHQVAPGLNVTTELDLIITDGEGGVATASTTVTATSEAANSAATRSLGGRSVAGTANGQPHTGHRQSYHHGAESSLSAAIISSRHNLSAYPTSYKYLLSSGSQKTVAANSEAGGSSLAGAREEAEGPLAGVVSSGQVIHMLDANSSAAGPIVDDTNYDIGSKSGLGLAGQDRPAALFDSSLRAHAPTGFIDLGGASPNTGSETVVRSATGTLTTIQSVTSVRPCAESASCSGAAQLPAHQRLHHEYRPQTTSNSSHPAVALEKPGESKPLDFGGGSLSKNVLAIGSHGHPARLLEYPDPKPLSHSEIHLRTLTTDTSWLRGQDKDLHTSQSSDILPTVDWTHNAESLDTCHPFGSHMSDIVHDHLMTWADPHNHH